jgi:hypothetical protein
MQSIRAVDQWQQFEKGKEEEEDKRPIYSGTALQLFTDLLNE